jgi:flagellar assembly protein FliH
MKKIGPRKIIKAKEAEHYEPFNFRSFNQKPVNYLIDVISDHAVENTSFVSDEEFDARLKEKIEAEKEQLSSQFKKRAEQQYRMGQQKGREEATEELRRAIDLLAQYSRLLIQEKQEVTVRYEKEVLDLAFQLAEKIIGRELELKPESVADVAKKALEQVVDSENVKLRVNPDDLDYVKAVYADLEAVLSSNAKLDIRSEPTIERGGCIVETEAGVLDARILTQLETLKSNINVDTAGR